MPAVPRGAKLCSPSALSGSEVRTRDLRLPSAALPGPESRNFMMVDTMLRAVFTMARVLVTMLLQMSCTPPEHKSQRFQDKIDRKLSSRALILSVCIPMSWKAFNASLVSSTLRINHNKGSESWHVDNDPCRIRIQFIIWIQPFEIPFLSTWSSLAYTEFVKQVRRSSGLTCRPMYPQAM